MKYIIALLHLLAGDGHECNATRFGDPGDKYVGGKAIALGRRVNQTDIGVAHRTLPMGTVLTICNPRAGKCAVARVVDRGPYGKRGRDGKWHNACPGRQCKEGRRATRRRRWRSCLDLTPALSDRLGHNGFENVVYREAAW